MINSYIALDLEMTGLNPATDRIMEIGAARVIDGQIEETLSTLVNPQVPLSDKVMDLTKITPQMLQGKPLIEDVIEQLVIFTQGLPLLGHNIIFDYSFIKKAAVNHKLKFERDGIDTLKIARRVLPDLEHKRLEDLCTYFAIDPGNNHRALDDALSAMQVYQKLFEVDPQDKGFSETIKLHYNVKRDTPITPRQVTFLSELLEKHQIVLEADIKSLTKSQASRMIDKIRATYGK